MAMSSAEKQAAFKKRMKAAGFVQVTSWVHVMDLERHKKYTARLRKEREGDDK